MEFKTAKTIPTSPTQPTPTPLSGLNIAKKAKSVPKRRKRPARALQKCKKRAKKSEHDSSPKVKKPHKNILDCINRIAQLKKERKSIRNMSQKNIWRLKTETKQREAPRNSKAAFRRLQEKWYNKLRDKGFADIERYDAEQGNKHICELINWQKRGWQRRLESTREFYQCLTNFITHNPRFYTHPETYPIRVAAKLYEKGHSYSEVANELYKRGLIKSPNKAYAHKLLKPFIAKVMQWNKENPEGLFYAEGS